MESILTSIKKLLGISEEYTHFDNDIIMHINTVLMVLNQLGIGPEEGFLIFDKSAMWNDFISSDNKNLHAIKTYVYLKVKLLFDPPLSSAVMEATNRLISELEWRLNVLAEELTNTTPEDNAPAYDEFIAMLGSACLGSMKLGYTGG